MGKSTISMVMFNSYVSHYQRVVLIIMIDMIIIIVKIMIVIIMKVMITIMILNQVSSPMSEAGLSHVVPILLSHPLNSNDLDPPGLAIGQGLFDHPRLFHLAADMPIYRETHPMCVDPIPIVMPKM